MITRIKITNGYCHDPVSVIGTLTSKSQWIGIFEPQQSIALPINAAVFATLLKLLSDTGRKPTSSRPEPTRSNLLSP